MSIVTIGDSIAALQQRLIDENRASTEDYTVMIQSIGRTKSEIAAQLVELGKSLTAMFESLEDLLVRSAAERSRSLDEAIGIKTPIDGPPKS